VTDKIPAPATRAPIDPNKMRDTPRKRAPVRRIGAHSDIADTDRAP
jgi:hypothetical protein